MCLYPKMILNRKYTPTKKNGGNVPILWDDRVKYVPVGCGNCIECRKQKARAWQIRLHEEIKIQANRYFCTLTFTDENLALLEKETNTSECNAVAGLAVRRFLERWRKKYKKSVTHWLITELGHNGTERIHLHGILFTEFPITNNDLTSIWKYGRTDTGEYCNERSINYIIKYVTKIDREHKGYIPQIFCSAGLGKNYLKSGIISQYKYTKGNTREYYILPNGQKVNMPIYYRNHIWNENEREEIWKDRIEQHTIYVNGIECKNLNTEKGLKHYVNVLKKAQENNEAIGYGDDSKEWAKKEYNTKLKALNENRTLQNLQKLH